MASRAAFSVEGLDCAEEISLLRGALGKVGGVVALDFDLLNARMTVTYDEAAVRPDELLARIGATGMRASLSSPDATAAPPFWSRHGRTLAAAASGAFLLAGFAWHWAAHGTFVGALVMGHGSGGHALPAASVLLYWGAVLAGAWYVLPRAAASVAGLRPDMNLLMVVAVMGAMVLGEWFEAGTVAFLFAVAVLLEHWSVDRARRAIRSLLELTPPIANCVGPEDGLLEPVPVADVPVGRGVVVRPGERVPLDGVVLSGESLVNQAPITGESRRVAKQVGDPVYAGTINESGSITFEVTRPSEDTTLAHMIRLLRESQSRRAPSEQWVERFARYYTPAMMGLAAVVFVAPPLLFAGAWGEWLYRALVLLVIACPCALVISTPVTIVSALASAARNGVLIKGGAHLEAVGRVAAMALDKTGTLTYGRPQVRRLMPLDGHSEADLLMRAARVEADSVHPLADAILREANARGLPVRRPEGFRSLEGKGAEGRLDGRLYWVGSHKLMDERGAETPQAHRTAVELEEEGDTVVAVGSEDHVCGLISVADAVRTGASEVVADLRHLGVGTVVMLTGDNEETARAVARATGADAFRAELLPAQKVEAVRDMVGRLGPTAMVGDGVNDAPAMAAATVGIAMGGIGADAAIETADITLMADELEKLPWLMRHSRRAVGTVKQNVAFALGVKFLFFVLALLGSATLWMAIAADMGASLAVTFSGLRLLRVR